MYIINSNINKHKYKQKQMAGKTPTTTTTTRKASASTEIVLGQAAQKIAKAVLELNSATETVNKLVSQAEEMTLQVANKENQIAELVIEYQEKSRQAEVEFNLAIKSNQNDVVNSVLRANGQEAVSSDELRKLSLELQATKENAEAETKKQVQIVSASLKSGFENDLRFIQSENKAVAAENSSKIGVLVEKNNFLEEQVTKLYHQLDAERAAGIERAKAASIGSISVGDTSKR